MKADCGPGLDAEQEASQGYSPNAIGSRPLSSMKVAAPLTIRAAATPASRSRRGGTWARSSRGAGRLPMSTAPSSASSMRGRMRSRLGHGVDWSTGEALAFGSLLLRATRCACPSDSERGTFSQAPVVR